MRTPALLERLLFAIAAWGLAGAAPGVALGSPPAYMWNRGYGGTQRDLGLAVSTDASGNVFFAGSFYGTSSFGGAWFTSAGDRDIFLAKTDADGNYLWSKHFGSTLFDQIESIVSDTAGNVFVTGCFNGVVDFGGGPLTSAGNDDIFIAKFGPGGEHLWSKRLGSTSVDNGHALAVDSAGGVVVAGRFTGSVNFGGGVLTSAGMTDAFVARFDASGSHVWSRRFGGTSSDYANDLALDSEDRVVLVGTFGGTVSFGGASFTGSNDVFIAQFDASCNHVWSRAVTCIGSILGVAIATDDASAVYVTGFFTSQANFGGGLLTPWGISDIFLAKYEASGAHAWSHRYGSSASADEAGQDVAISPSGSVVMAGYFVTNANFGGDVLTSAGFEDAFYASFDADGNHEWSFRFGGGGYDEIGVSIDFDATGHLVSTGIWGAQVDFGGGMMTAAGESDVFLVRYEDAATGVEPIATVDPRSMFELSMRGANPATREVRLCLELPHETDVTVDIVDVFGRRVRELVRGCRSAGTHDLTWNPREPGGEPAAAGIYWVRASGNGVERSQKLVLVR